MAWVIAFVSVVVLYGVFKRREDKRAKALEADLVAEGENLLAEYRAASAFMWALASTQSRGHLLPEQQGVLNEIRFEMKQVDNELEVLRGYLFLDVYYS